MVHDGTIAREHLEGDNPLVFGNRYLGEVLDVRDFPRGWQVKLRQLDDQVRREPLRVQPTLRNWCQGRQISSVPFGRARIDPCDQRIDLRLAKARIVAEL